MLATFTTTVRSEIDLDSRPRDGPAEPRPSSTAEHAPLVEALAEYEAKELPGRLAAMARGAARRPAAWSDGG